jgi:hypothetical protein
LVVDGEVRLGEGDAVEGVVAEAKGMGVGNETALVAKDVFDVPGADVAGLHDLRDGADGRGGPEQLDEQGESDDFLVDGARAGGEELEVRPSGVGEGRECGRQRAGGGARLVIEQGLLVRGVLTPPLFDRSPLEFAHAG